MTTYIIYSNPTDGHIVIADHDYQKSRMGTGATKAVVTGAQINTGQNHNNALGYHTYEGFFSFDTSVIADAEEIVDANLSIYSGWTASNHSTSWGQRFCLTSWTAPLTTAQWKNPTNPGPIVANFDYLTASTPFARRATGSDELIENINKTGLTQLVSISNNTIGGWSNVPTEIWTSGGESANPPYLVVYTTALNTMNMVELASTTLTDGTTISLRSNGTASPTITIGYQPVMGSWTSLGNINPAFNRTVDGQNSFALSSDADGNFYLVGANLTGKGVVAMAFVRTSSTTWTQKTPLQGQIPMGNDKDVRSITALYMGGTGPNDKPFIRVYLTRGASGVNPGYPNHVSGAGWGQDIALDPVALKNGSGALLRTAANAYWQVYGHNTVGVPTFVDSAIMTPNLAAVYFQRGKFGNQEVGGLFVNSSVDAGGTASYKSNIPYVETGASKLVPINAQKFAHVYDAAGRELRIQFFNERAQLLGGTSIDASHFYQGTIGRAWAAHYDPVSDLVRVHYVNDSGLGRALDRTDISATTYAQTTAGNVTTALGAAGSVNTVLRVSENPDERRVLIEAGNVAGTTLSTQVYISTAGNIAPTAPLTSTRTAFDAVLNPADFSWTFSDRNPKDVQSAYQVEISRATDAVIIKDTGKVTAADKTYTLPVNSLLNNVEYRWRVRVYDTVGAAGAWSAYQNFVTSTTGTVTITDPVIDGMGGIETSSYAVKWTYTGSQGQRQVRVYQVSGNVLVHDSGMATTSAGTYTIPSLESGVEYRIEVSLINAAGITVPTVTRLITTNYSMPMTPQTEISVAPTYIEILVVNPVPSGDRPEIRYNDIYRRENKPLSTEADFVRIGTTNYNGTYRDYAVKSGKSYDYRVVGRTN